VVEQCRFVGLVLAAAAGARPAHRPEPPSSARAVAALRRIEDGLSGTTGTARADDGGLGR